MANKYSRYELQPFPSLYVDNKQPEIAQLLAQRFDANKTSKDLIDRTLSQLELLEGDKGHLERIKTEVKGSLKDHIDKGDWENSSLVVADAAQMVETDAGLIAANKSMQNRQAEINAVREGKLNGIPMLDFGGDARKSHQSYYYDEEIGGYVTNVYEPMMETQLDYRTRKEKMIGKIPASQKGNWMGVSRGKTNKTANLMVEQYITDTKEGAQEYKKLVEMDLPSSIPMEERAEMAKAQILQDFREVARQQEYSKTTGSTGEDTDGSGGRLKKGITIKSSTDTEIRTGFDNMGDKIRGINQRQIALNALIADDATSATNKELYQRELNSNEKLLHDNMAKIAKSNGDKGKAALADYDKLRDGYSKYGDDGQRLMSATQQLTYNPDGLDTDTDWGNIFSNTMIAAGAGMAAGSTIGATGFLAGPTGIATTAGGALIGGLWGAATGFVSSLGFEWGKESLRNVRDWHRPQEGGGITGSLGLTDSEREQLHEELWGDSDLDDASVERANSILGTNFQQNDIKDLMDLTGSYYTFMTDDSEGTRMSGDDLMEQTSNKVFTVNQPTLGFDSSAEGKKLRTATSGFVQNEIALNNAGISFEGMTNNSKEMTDWMADDIGGANKLSLEGVLLPDIASNTPLRLTFGSTDDATGDVNRTAYITDPTVLQPGGWVYDLIDKNYGEGDKVYNEIIRQDYDRRGYENVTMDDYSGDLAQKTWMYKGGSEEDVLEYKRKIEDQVIMSMLINPDFDYSHYQDKSSGIRGVQGQTNFIPFQLQDGSFNQDAWYALQNRPAELAGLRQGMLKTNLRDFGGTAF